MQIIILNINVKNHSNSTFRTYVACCTLSQIYLLTDVSVWSRFIVSVLPDRLQMFSVILLNPQRWNDPKSQVTFCIHIILAVWVRQLQAPMKSSQTSCQNGFDLFDCMSNYIVVKDEGPLVLYWFLSIFILKNKRLPFLTGRLFSWDHLKCSVNLPTGCLNKMLKAARGSAHGRWEGFWGHATINYILSVLFSVSLLLCHKQLFIVGLATQTWSL